MIKKRNEKINNAEKFELLIENEEKNNKALHNAEILWKQYDVFTDYVKNRSKTFEEKTKGAMETIK